MSSTLDLIKSSFEGWYRAHVDTKASIVINYSDEQTLLIKAYHKVTVNMSAIGIKDNLSYTVPLIEVSENYNHGVTTEEEAKESVIENFLTKIFDYCRQHN